MSNASKCLALVAALALAGTVSAVNFTEDFDGSNGPWTDSTALGGTNGWVHVSGPDNKTTTATGGLAGTRGAEAKGSANFDKLAFSQFPGLVPGDVLTSGTFEFFVAVDVSGGLSECSRAYQIGLSDDATGGREFEVEMFGCNQARVRSLPDAAQTPVSAPTFDMGWQEWRINYNRDTGLISTAYRDIDDTVGQFIGLGTFTTGPSLDMNTTTTGLFNATHMYIRGFGLGDSMKVDRLSSTALLPEPATLSVVMIGGLLLLRRRRRASLSQG